MKRSISVIICTHNPRQNYLDRVLAALKSQTLPFEQWELLLIDNASEQTLSKTLDLGWHPNTRHIREDQLGLTPARLRGIREAQADVLVFVDDDNILDSDYLEVVLQISHENPQIGAWGGQIRAEFEVPPPEWAKPYLPYLAIREFSQDRWSNFPSINESTPCGAGMCVRKVVAQKYGEFVKSDPKRMGLDRKGDLLASCGDSDLALTACDIALGMGQFKNLKLIHLIPSNRLQEGYLLRLMEGMSYSCVILQSFRGNYPTKPLWTTKLIQYCKRWRNDPITRRFSNAWQRGSDLAFRELTDS